LGKYVCSQLNFLDLKFLKTKERVEIVLQEVGLSDAQDTLNKNLSGVQQRLVANICLLFVTLKTFVFGNSSTKTTESFASRRGN
jgi:energy-coupling factor transporter ATP-binding protein EcfA2